MWGEGMIPFKQHNYLGLNTAYDINFGPGTRFFFFKSLIEKAKYNNKANNILQQANSVIQMNGENSSINEQEFLNSTIAAIQFLKNMADFELQNEIALFNSKIAPLLSGKYAAFKDCYTPTNVDYPRFMSLLKLLEDDNHEAFLQLQEMGLKMKKYNETITPYLADYDTLTKFKQHKREITIDSKKKFKESTIIADEMANTLDNYDQHSSITEEEYNYIKENIFSMLLSGETEKELSSTQSKVLELDLLSKLKLLSTKQRQNKNTGEMEIITDFKNLLLEIQEDEKKREEIIKKLQVEKDKIIQQADLLQQQGELIEKKISSITSVLDYNKISKGLTVDVRKKISNILKDSNLEIYNTPTQIKVEGDKRELIFNINSKEGINTYINALKTSLGMEDATEEEVLNKIEHIIKNASKRKEILTLASEGRSIKNLAWVVDAIQANLDGILNGKNDATIYTIGKAFLKKDTLTEEEKSQIKNLLKQNEELYNNLYKVSMIVEGKPVNTFDAKTQTELQDIVEEYNIAGIRQILSKQQNDINNIKDLFQIDSSVKFYETFNEYEGFSGGSLGADVESQINNINYMLSLGGITPMDASWLMTAVLNAGDDLIGSNQRSALENYFSTVASMLMFRSGGNAIQQWANMGGEYYNNTTTKIHIYTFQTYYVPESYILYKTYEGLNNCINLLQTSASNEGSRASIFNPVSEGDEIQTSYNIQGHTLLQPDWQKTSDKNYKRVQIEMALLGGFLDLQEELLNELNNFLN